MVRRAGEVDCGMDEISLRIIIRATCKEFEVWIVFRFVNHLGEFLE